MSYMYTRLDEHRQYPIPECDPVPFKRYVLPERQAVRNYQQGIR